MRALPYSLLRLKYYVETVASLTVPLPFPYHSLGVPFYVLYVLLCDLTVSSVILFDVIFDAPSV